MRGTQYIGEHKPRRLNVKTGQKRNIIRGGARGGRVLQFQFVSTTLLQAASATSSSINKLCVERKCKPDRLQNSFLRTVYTSLSPGAPNATPLRRSSKSNVFQTSSGPGRQKGGYPCKDPNLEQFHYNTRFSSGPIKHPARRIPRTEKQTVSGRPVQRS